jgi:hypothetical protein
MTTPDRDRSVEQWLRQTPIPGAPPELCLDADTLAAWSDGTLDGLSRATAEAHAASCGRCQAMLAAMVRTMPAAPAASPAWSPRRWMMMLAPAAAAAAAVALWVAVGRPTEQSVLRSTASAPAAAEPATSAVQASPSASERDTAAAPRDAVASVDAESEKRLADARSERESRVGADKKDGDASYRFRRDDRANERKAEELRSGMEGLRAKVDRAAAAAKPAEQPPVGAIAETVQNAPASRPATPPPPPPAPVAEPRQVVQTPPAPQQMTQAQQQAGLRQQQAAEPSQQQAQQQAKEQVANAAERPAASAAGRGGAFGGVVADELLLVRKAAGIVEAVAPGASVRWRVVDGRVVQRSGDGGATWTDQYTANVGVQLTSGAAASPTVCWFVGRAGLVVRTTDGRAWALVSFPERLDLASITAADAQSASVTTVDGRVFVTTDGGATWRRR